jgi:hypothetical protein
VTAAVEFLRAARITGLTRGVFGNVLKTINLLADSGNLVMSASTSDSRPSCALPRDSRTLENRADGDVYLDSDSIMYTTIISQMELLQTRQHVKVWKTNVVDVLQKILLDPSYPAGSLYMQRRCDIGAEFVTAEGEVLRTFEAFGSDRWKDLLTTVPADVYLLAVAVHSDGVVVGETSYYPWSVTVVNFPYRFRKGKHGLMKMGFAEKPVIRKPRNSHHSEKLSPYQKDCKNALTSRIAADIIIFFFLEFAAAIPLRFAVRDLDGKTREYNFAIRLHHSQQDIEEWQACNGVSGKTCNDCNGVEKAMANGAGVAGSRNRPFLKTSLCCMCATAELRSPEKYFKQQAAFMLQERRYGKTVAGAAAKAVRVRYRIPNALLRMINFIPHGICGGPFFVNGLDILHGLRTGCLHHISFYK